jgi:hypothetical protein
MSFVRVSFSLHVTFILESFRISLIMLSRAEFANPIARLGSISTFLNAFSNVRLAVS